MAGYKLLVPRGYDFEVNFLGKAATWLLYASLAFTMVTEPGTDWPRGTVLGGRCTRGARGNQYLLKARREVGRA